MNIHVFPGQGSQFVGMGKDLYQSSEKAKQLFHNANTILDFDITNIMFEGTAEDLQDTSVTQPAIFIHSVIDYLVNNTIETNYVAGHSLGEFSALVANNCISFEDGLRLVITRANAMKKACKKEQTSMAAIIGLENSIVENELKSNFSNTFIANFNSNSQLVISGLENEIDACIDHFKAKGAKIVVKLKVDGAFHTKYMKEAEEELSIAIHNVKFNAPSCPIIQNYTGLATTNIDTIKGNLINQLSSPVKWHDSMVLAKTFDIVNFTEFGPGKVLTNLFKRM